MSRYSTPEDDAFIVQFHEQKKLLERQANSLRATSTRIGKGGIRVNGGGNISIEDQGSILISGGNLFILTIDGFQAFTAAPSGIFLHGGSSINVLDGGTIRALYDDGTSGALWGSLVNEVTGVDSGHGVLIQADSAGSGRDIFRAIQRDDGLKVVWLGSIDSPGVLPEDAVPIEQFTSEAELTRLRNYGSGDAFMICYDGDSVVRAENGAARLSSDIFEAFTAYAGTGSAANCHLTVDGQIMRNTSSRRFKQDIRDAEINPDDVLKLRPRSWLPNGEVTGGSGNAPGKLGDDGGSRNATRTRGMRTRVTLARPKATQSTVRQVGFVSEELDEIGLGQFVEHDENGQAGGIAYDRLTAALLVVVQKQQKQIAELTSRVNQLEGI